jgi:steroid delta-isomerase-like uncharacterized protein
LSVSGNINVIKREIKAFNGRDWDAYLACFDKSIVTLEPEEDKPILGHEGLRRRVATYTNAFPDVHLETERLFGDEEYVCLNSLFIGTHKGDLPGPNGTKVPGTGKPVRVHGCSVFRFRNEKITEFIGYYDQVELFTQIGKKVRLQ